MKIIVDLGGTKGDWRFISNDGSVVQTVSRGFSPVVQKLATLELIISSELPFPDETVHEVHYYGTGVHGEDVILSMVDLLKESFRAKFVSVNTDLFAACRATCQDQAGIVSILGTGSSSCLYDGNTIIDKIPSLGYIAGDEGAGASIGRSILQTYFYREMPSGIREQFEKQYNLSRTDFLENTYRQPGANTYLGSFADFAITNKDNDFIRNLISEELDRFVSRHLVKYNNENGALSCHFVGSVAWFLQDELKSSLEKYNLKSGKVIRKPIEHLVAFHQS